MDNMCIPCSLRSKTVSSAASYLNVCKRGALPAETDGHFTHTDTHTLPLSYTNSHVHKHTNNGSQIRAFTGSHRGEPAEHTHPCIGELLLVPILKNWWREREVWMDG